jgi:hypothetical protein
MKPGFAANTGRRGFFGAALNAAGEQARFSPDRSALARQLDTKEQRQLGSLRR